MNESTHEDAFNLLCGRLIGEGIHRKVFECRFRTDWVVKVETGDGWRNFANVREMQFWSDFCEVKKVAVWLAPCEYLSPDGKVLIQRRVIPVHDLSALPDKVPGFLSDLKPENFGYIDGRLVCCDYAGVIYTASERLKKVAWQ